MQVESDKQTMTPAEIIRRNFASLKEDLHPEEVIDDLWSSHVFSDSERRTCKEQGGQRAQTDKLLELVAKKGDKAYKEFCAALHRNHEHLKELLDNTAKGGDMHDGSSLVFVSEAEVQKRVTEMEQKIADLRKERDDARQEVEDIKAEHEKVLMKVTSKHQEEETNLKKENRQLNTKLISVQTKLEKTKGQEESMSEKCLHLQQDLEETQKKLEALTTINMDGKHSEKTISLKPPAPTVEETACVLQTSPDCDTGQLLLLTCLHAACKPCIDQQKQKDIVCPCGRGFTLEKEHATVDFVRRNEIVFATDKHECQYLTKQCNGKVVSRCRTCNIFMCADCNTKHDTTTTSSQHAVVFAENFNEMPIRERLPRSICSNHPTEEVTYFDEECNTSVCRLCVRGKHRDHSIKDLDETFQETKKILDNKLDQTKEHLEKIQTSSRQAQSRMTELEEMAHQLKKEIADVHTDLALQLVERLKIHRQQIENEVEKYRRDLQKDMECLGKAELAILATLDYSKRAMTSTSSSQFMNLSSAIVSKIGEDLCLPLPEDLVKTMALTFTPKGHKALSELVAMFGELSMSDKDVDNADTVPTITEFEYQLGIFKAQEKAFETEKERAMEVAAFLTDKLKTSEIFFLDVRKMDLSSLCQCTHLKFDMDKINLNAAHINTEGDLVNRESNTTSVGEGRLKKYRGTCSTIPLPRTGCLQYWETEARVGLDQPITGDNLILEVGVCVEEEMDKTRCVAHRPHAYSLTVSHCTKHEGICRVTWKEGKVVLHLPFTITNTAGASRTLYYGVAYDVARRKIVFIDVKEKKVMSTFDNVDSSQTLWPMFGTYNAHCVTVSMRLVVGSDINMTEEKKAMIVKALASS